MSAQQRMQRLADGIRDDSTVSGETILQIDTQTRDR